MIKIIVTFYFIFGIYSSQYAQSVMPLYNGKVPNSKEVVGLKETIVGNHFVLRVDRTDLTVFLPQKSKVTKWSIISHIIGIEVNSARGHLASTSGTHFQKVCIDNSLMTSLHPDFMILNYPVINILHSLTYMGSRYNLIGEELSTKELDEIMKNGSTSEQKLASFHLDMNKIKEYSNKLNLTKNTPSTFITHSEDNKVVKV